MPSEFCLVPIRAKDQAVNVICLQTTKAFDDDVLERMTRIAKAATACYERLLRKEERTPTNASLPSISPRCCRP